MNCYECHERLTDASPEPASRSLGKIFAFATTVWANIQTRQELIDEFLEAQGEDRSRVCASAVGTATGRKLPNSRTRTRNWRRHSSTILEFDADREELTWDRTNGSRVKKLEWWTPPNCRECGERADIDGDEVDEMYYNGRRRVCRKCYSPTILWTTATRVTTALVKSAGNCHEVPRVPDAMVDQWREAICEQVAERYPSASVEFMPESEFGVTRRASP